MKIFIGLLFCGAMCCPALAGLNPKDDVKAVIARLAEKPNYSWTAISKDNNPPANNDESGRSPFLQLGTAPIEGKAVKAGINLFSSKLEDNTVVQVATKSDVTLVKTKEGWKLADEPQRRGADRNQGGAPETGPGQRDPAGAGAGAAAGAARSAAPEGGFRPPGQFGFGGAPGQLEPSTLLARRLQFTRSPVVEAQEFLDKATNLKLAGIGYWVGELPEAGIRDLLQRRMGGNRGNREGRPQFEPRMQGTKATVKFWATGGILSRYETSIETKLFAGPNQDREININRSSTTEIRQVGMTRIDLPKEAFALLLGTPTAPKTAAPQAAPTRPAPKPTEEK